MQIDKLINTIKAQPGIKLSQLVINVNDQYVNSIIRDLAFMGYLLVVKNGSETFLFLKEETIVFKEYVSCHPLKDRKFNVVVNDGHSDIFYSNTTYDEARQQFEEYKKLGLNVKLCFGMLEHILDISPL